MELTSKERAKLKSLASVETAIFQIGKNSLTPEMIEGIDQALNARELIKLSVLKNCADNVRTLANTIAERTHSVVVTVIGKKIVLYRPSKKDIIKLRG